MTDETPDRAGPRDGSTGSETTGTAHGDAGRRDLPPDHDHWLVRPSTIRLLWVVFVAILALTVIPDFFIHQHEYFGIEATFGFYAWFGFGTCVAMVVGAKVLGFLIKRPDDYYDG